MAMGVCAVWFLMFVYSVLCRSNSNIYSLESRWLYLKTLSQVHNFVNFDASRFRKHVYFPERNYSVVLLFTSENCQLCKTMRSEFEIVAQSWHKSANHNYGLFIGYVDYEGDGRKIFKQLRIEKTPIILYFEKGTLYPTKVALKHRDMAEQLAKFLSTSTSTKFEIRRPIDWVMTLVVATTFMLAASFAYYKRDFLGELSSIGSVCIINIMTSGHIFNCIRGGHLIGKFQDGFKLKHFVQPTKRQQYIVEAPIVFAFFSTIGYAMIFLGAHKSLSAVKRNVMLVSFLAAIFISISVLSSMTRVKVYGYPYSFKF